MLDIIEKQRKILSGNKETIIHLESLLDDEDLKRNITRQEFEELIQPMIARFVDVLNEAITLSGKLTFFFSAGSELNYASNMSIFLSYSC
jgi:molecular chaperone DnaK (HSP70)